MNLGSIGDVFGSAISAYSNHREAEMNRDWQENQRATAYQTTVRDLQAAGLSPMLAYSKGPTSGGSGATAAPMQPLKLGETEQRTTSSDLSRAQVDVAKTQEQVNIASARKTAAEADLAAQKVLQEPARFYLEQAALGSQINSSTAQANQTFALELLTRQGKAPAPDTNIVRNIKDAASYGSKGFTDAKSVLDNFINRSYKSIRGIK
jgi:hypothetical protein